MYVSIYIYIHTHIHITREHITRERERESERASERERERDRPPMQQSLAGEIQGVEVLLVEDSPGKRRRVGVCFRDRRSPLDKCIACYGFRAIMYCAVLRDVAWACCLSRIQ